VCEKSGLKLAQCRWRRKMIFAGDTSQFVRRPFVPDEQTKIVRHFNARIVRHGRVPKGLPDNSPAF
jgi:hypothetical protein